MPYFTLQFLNCNCLLQFMLKHLIEVTCKILSCWLDTDLYRSWKIITKHFRLENVVTINVFEVNWLFCFSLGSWPAQSSGEDADKNYNYLALSWSNTGDLFFNLNGQETHISSNFARNVTYRLIRGSERFFIIGGNNFLESNTIVLQ